MKVLVISDSHGITSELSTLIADYRSQVDYIVHCGDSELTSHDTLWGLTDSVVKGNMDFDSGYKTEDILQTKDYRFFVTHGHLYDVNFERYKLADRAKEEHCAFALYGHTHVLKVEVINHVICINPGSFNRSRGPIQERTFAVIDVSLTQAIIRYYRADRTCIDELTEIYRLT
ncbi:MULTISPECIES: YfcE family phosphodiesterase [unclassified Granulicatella]|uniref:YfcE family phosphodiesterase n=1 Tax=unclassified Granulicatella TaxID=2630493 RepID=UPI0010743290|nr:MULTISPECIES: metallophosphoesterase [unclassified Granulicatella]MBF0780498.1 metallophosphoesterase [Granulicatella sp. 19428wC4_WM01]TFU95356.1 metallophosphoesterase [Granulicatella sp. WM01]